LVLLKDLLSNENKEQLLKAVAFKSKADVQRLVVNLQPKTDKRDVVRKMVQTERKTEPAIPIKEEANPPIPLVGVQSFTSCLPTSPLKVALMPAQGEVAAKHTTSIEAITKVRTRVAFTVDEQFMKNLREMKALFSHKYPDGNLANIIGEALTYYIEHGPHRSKRKMTSPAKTSPTLPTRYIPVAVRDSVRRRDNGRCQFRAPDGKRCESTQWIEFDHRRPFVDGGASTVENLRILCGTHNRWLAAQRFGSPFW
jgi:hypothetical protein